MMVFLYIILAVFGISSIITFLIVFLINKSSNRDDYDEVENAKTKKFDPDHFDEDDDQTFSNDALIISENLDLINEDNNEIFIEEVKSEEELDKVDFLENTQTKLKIRKKDIKNKFNSDNKNKEELKELEKTSNNLKLNIGTRDRKRKIEKPIIEPVIREDREEEII